MIVLKWICFLFVCLDVLNYVLDELFVIDNAVSFAALCVGITFRVVALYGTVTCWLLK